MLKILFIAFFLLAAPFSCHASTHTLNDTKGAFIRDGNLWTIIHNEQKQITISGHVSSPSWSHDGRWLVYQEEAPTQFENNKMQNEIWVFNIETGEKKKIFYNGFNPQWAPHKNWVAFQDNEVLNISDLENFHNVSLGVFDYIWLPDGQHFLLSSQANIEPNGWTNPILFKKEIPKTLNEANLFANVNIFFTVPKELEVDNNNVMSINVNTFAISPSHKWISFIVSPTASLAMDSNMLCTISADGKSFEAIDVLIRGVGEPKWAPSKDILAYIAGEGRIVFGFKNKDLKYKEYPVSSSLTPENYAELNFTWVSNESIITSRVEEKEWSNEFSEHPLPSLYSINLNDQSQIRVSNPPPGFGDYDPIYIKSIDKLLWYRGKSITDRNRDIWISNQDGSNAELWLQNVENLVLW